MRHTMRSCRVGMLVLAVLALIVLSSPARADLVFSLEPGITATAGSTGNAFDVLLTNTGSPVTVGGFSFGITAADPAINFTEANISTTVDTYIFSGDSLFGPTISTLTGQTLEASDFSSSGFGTSIGTSVTLGVGHILFDVAGNATPGPIAVTFEDFPTTSLSDTNPSPNELAFKTTPGTITITSATTVPEPAPAGLLICALAGFAILIQRRRRGSLPR